MLKSQLTAWNFWFAEAVVKAAETDYNFKFLYPIESTIPDKIFAIASKVYGANAVEILPQAKKDIERLESWGYGNLPVCMAKTHLLLSHDPKLKGRPKNFEVPVREIRLSSGAGFVYALCGDMMTMPGLPSSPGGMRVDIDENGEIVGLF